jgi:hypothetical protein
MNICTGVQGTGGAGEAHRREGLDRDLPGVPTAATGFLPLVGRIAETGSGDRCRRPEPRNASPSWSARSGA